MKKKLIAIVAVLLVAAITGVTWAQVTGTTSIGISTAGVGGEFVNAQAASAAGFSNLYHGQNPSWSPIENAPGNISAGDVYSMDVTAYTGDILVTLQMTNVPELGACYTYILQQTNVYTKTATSNPVATTAVTSESLGAALPAGTQAGTLAHFPVVAGSETFTASAGTVTASSLNDQTGAYSVTFTVTAPATTTNITVAYTYYNEAVNLGLETAVTTAESPNITGGIAAALANLSVKFHSETVRDGATDVTLVRGVDYTIVYKTGVITLRTGGYYAAAANYPATVAVTYNYYKTSGTHNAGLLLNTPVKAASETVRDIGASTATTLVRGTDYTIAYDSGTITMLAGAGQYATSAAFPATVAVTYDYFTYGRAETVVATGAETIVSGAIVLAAGSTQTLDHPPVKPGSETIKNDTTTLVRGTDYTIAYGSGTITFLKAVTVAATKLLTAGYTYSAWTQPTLADGTAIGTVYLSLQNGFVSFILAGNAYYDITIDDGSFYCISTTDDATHDLAPSYYLDVRQA